MCDEKTFRTDNKKIINLLTDAKNRMQIRNKALISLADLDRTHSLILHRGKMTVVHEGETKSAILLAAPLIVGSSARSLIITNEQFYLESDGDTEIELIALTSVEHIVQDPELGRRMKRIQMHESELFKQLL